jgi:hypothetical protein
MLGDIGLNIDTGGDSDRGGDSGSGCDCVLDVIDPTEGDDDDDDKDSIPDC